MIEQRIGKESEKNNKIGKVIDWLIKRRASENLELGGGNITYKSSLHYLKHHTTLCNDSKRINASNTASSE